MVTDNDFKLASTAEQISGKVGINTLDVYSDAQLITACKNSEENSVAIHGTDIYVRCSFKDGSALDLKVNAKEA